MNTTILVVMIAFLVSGTTLLLMVGMDAEERGDHGRATAIGLTLLGVFIVLLGALLVVKACGV